MTPEQQAFEDRCWEHYLAERARRTMPGDVEGEPTREGLFWRREDGLYGVLAFNTAWMAYQWGMQAVRGQGQGLADWESTGVSLPPAETPVLTMFNGEHRILERRWEHPMLEDTFQSFWYWDDPTDDGQDIDTVEVTHWMLLPGGPEQQEADHGR